LESKRIFLNQSLAEIWTILWGTHLERFQNHFIRCCRFVYFCLFVSPPVFLSFRSLRSLFFLCFKREGERKDINKQNVAVSVPLPYGFRPFEVDRPPLSWLCLKSQFEILKWAQRAFTRPGNSASFRGLNINKEIDRKSLQNVLFNC
jgi:hypothetical protein